VPQTFAEALELAARQQREIEGAKAQIAELAPAAEQYHRWQFSGDTVYIVEWAKSIGLTQQEAFNALRELGVLFKQQHESVAFNVPKRGWERYFQLVDEFLPGPRRWTKVPKITAEGQVVLAELLLEHGWIEP
jgi:phage antirepressor YoqD-like protein